MRKLSIAAGFMLILTGSLFGADDLQDFRPTWTLHELAAAASVPVKSLAASLDLELRSAEGETLSSLGISRADATKAIADYHENEDSLVVTIVIEGMSIVFGSLIVVAFLISLFKHFHLFDRKRSARKPRSVKSVVGTITSQGDLGELSIAAVVAAIFLHEKHVDAENRLLLTWKRASAGAWRRGQVMPNATYFATRRGSR